MQYAKWTDNEKFKEKLVKYDRKEELETSGLPLMYDDKYLYLNCREGHNLVVGSTGSGKTQTIILPLARMAIKAEESFLIHDVHGHAYNVLSGMLNNAGYKIIALDFKNALVGNNWNPLLLPYQYYLNNSFDEAIRELETVAYYLFYEDKNESDFWINSAIDYFVGISLYLFKYASDKEINLESVYDFGNYAFKHTKEIYDSLEKNTPIYYNLSRVLDTPNETKGGILATFNVGLKKYVFGNNLANMLSSSDFSFQDIMNKKTAVFILSGNNNSQQSLVPLFINQFINSSDNNKRRFNILLDDFDNLAPIKDFSKLINYCRSINLNITAIIRSFKDLINTYGKEDTEIVKMCFSNIIYLLSNDYDTLEEVSKLCGNTYVNNQVQPLITIEELKILDYFEAIILMIREYPIRTKLLPDFKYSWDNYDKQELPLRIKEESKVFEFHG